MLHTADAVADPLHGCGPLRAARQKVQSANFLGSEAWLKHAINFETVVPQPTPPLSFRGT